MEQSHPLSLEEYNRYGRQLVVPEIGLKGQLGLKKTSVLVVGVGGLGCPAATYLAGAGIGRIGLVDGDAIEISNLQRQILHTSDRIGQFKVDSAIESLRALNPLATLVPHKEYLTSQNALDILSSYDLILDCTDHPTSRYLISDAAVLLRKPLISASALRTEGQLVVLNDPPAQPGDASGGPCYRCIFAKPPPPECIVGCGEGGILGPVVGVMGVLQALEAIKIIARKSSSEADVKHTDEANGSTKPYLLMYSAFSMPPFRSVRMRGRRKNCPACSSKATITAESLTSGSLDYLQFCGVVPSIYVLSPDERVSAVDYNRIRKGTNQGLGILIDVREKPHFNVCNLSGSINVPYSELMAWKDRSDASSLPLVSSEFQPIYMICRVGNDSQLAVKKLKALGVDGEGTRLIKDVVGGFKAWREDVDREWPDF